MAKPTDLSDGVATVIALPVTTPKGTAMFEIDVRSFGFLSVDELKRDPDWEKYVDAAVKAAFEKPESSD